jgi:hypothetical protein
MEEADGDKHCKNNYSCKKFYSTDHKRSIFCFALEEAKLKRMNTYEFGFYRKRLKSSK